MSQPELLKKVARALESAGVDYMITGSLASSLQGFPRATHDIDFVINIDAAALGNLAAAFPPPRFHFDETAAIEAVKRNDMFNLIEVETGIKVDFWPLTDDPFDRSRFARKQTEIVMGIPVMISSPEDTILMKLRWAKMSGGSEKQVNDALRVYEIQYENLELKYLWQWAKELDVMDLMKKLEDETRPD